ncbi:hypothetical protein DKX38_023444 [Salix brachista]|uniref:Anthocyanidin 3-O-glucosyltransferase n=1 Tax=Salix brachista TaxID=2182728 RepID=A0A5N5JPU2_9ROSI|nr:hypothetical protein DKX38_023444 [Salix brachista]
MKKAELVFIPAPGMSHLVSTVEVAKLLVDRDERLSITFLIMKLRSYSKIDSFIDSVSAASIRFRFIDLPEDEPDPNNPDNALFSFVETQKPYIKEEVSKLVSLSQSSPDSPTLVGLVLDMFCTPMIEVANEFGVPSYIFLTSGATLLGLLFHIQALHGEQKVDPMEFKDSGAELVVPCLANPYPVKVLPSFLLNKEGLSIALAQARRFRESNGIIVNTFEDLESRAINSFSNGNTPPVYPVGPMLNLNRDGDRDVESDKFKDIRQWLDDQPLSSVVYLCFGSRGSFGVDQVKEIACGLEQSGHRFLWSLRPPQPKEMGFGVEIKMDYRKEVNSDGNDDIVSAGEIERGVRCLMELDNEKRERLKEMSGKSRKAVESGGTSSTWLVVELGFGVEIKMDYRREFFYDGNENIVSAGELERGIRCLMELGEEKVESLKEMSEK